MNCDKKSVSKQFLGMKINYVVAVIMKRNGIDGLPTVEEINKYQLCQNYAKKSKNSGGASN